MDVKNITLSFITACAVVACQKKTPAADNAHDFYEIAEKTIQETGLKKIKIMKEKSWEKDAAGNPVLSASYLLQDTTAQDVDTAIYQVKIWPATATRNTVIGIEPVVATEATLKKHGCCKPTP